MLNRPRRSGPTVTNGSERLPSPLLIGLVKRILQHTRDRVIVFGDHEYETVIPCERFLPAQCLGVLAGNRNKRPFLIEERQWMVAKSDKLRLDVLRGLGLFQHPASGLVGVPPGPGRANHDGDAGFRGHDSLIFCFRMPLFKLFADFTNRFVWYRSRWARAWARVHLGGPRQCLRVDILPDVSQFAVSNGNGKNPMVFPRLIRG